MDNLGPHLNTKNVHIVPLGYEYDRIIKPLRGRADIVYLLVDDPTRDAETGTVDFDASCTSKKTDPASWIETTDYQHELRDEISEFAEVGGFPVRLDNFYDVMGVVTTIAAHHKIGPNSGDDVFVNISSGSHKTAVAAALGGMTVGARPYNVEPESYEGDHESKPRTQGASSPEPMPMHPIKGPTKDQIKVLRYLLEMEEKNYTTNKARIIKHFEDNEVTLECLGDAENTSRSSNYRNLDSKVLKGLTEKEYIVIDKDGRSKSIEITDSGLNILYAFGHLLR
jgi:DNA-binding MarR family transcriptional regulator